MRAHCTKLSRGKNVCLPMIIETFLKFSKVDNKYILFQPKKTYLYLQPIIKRMEMSFTFLGKGMHFFCMNFLNDYSMISLHIFKTGLNIIHQKTSGFFDKTCEPLFFPTKKKLFLKELLYICNTAA